MKGKIMCNCPEKMPVLKVFRVDKNVEIPEYKTYSSMCFDLQVSFNGLLKNVTPEISSGKRIVSIAPNENALIGTGLIFDIPKGWGIKLYPRSSTGLKMSTTLSNSVGIIDEDYVNEVGLILHNVGTKTVFIEEYSTLAQAEIVKFHQLEIVEINEKPEVKTNRTGGFGSTSNVKS